MRIHVPALLALALSLSSCFAPLSGRMPRLADRCLPGPEYYGASLWGSFVVRILSAGEESELSLQAEISGEKAVLVGFTPFGNRGMSIVSESGTVRAETNPSWRSPLGPEEILRIFQIALWPREGLETALSGCGLRVEESTAAWEQREVRRGDELLYRVDSFSGGDGVPLRIVTVPPAGAVVHIHGPR